MRKPEGGKKPVGLKTDEARATTMSFARIAQGKLTYVDGVGEAASHEAFDRMAEIAWKQLELP